MSRNDEAPLEAAISNNAQWCDAVCRTHGVRGEFDGKAWASSYRTPRLYPDAVTLSAHVDPTMLLSRVDASAGCSIKDSYCDLDLRAFGFVELFTARWLSFEHSQPPDDAWSEDDSDWARITTSADFVEWERGWRGTDGPSDVLRSRLLEDDRVVVLGEWRSDTVVSGVVLFETDGVVGVTNLFGPVGGEAETWRNALRATYSMFPGHRVVGYEAGDSLVFALAAGATDLGPLRVWVRPDD